jgi:hypothetical protein
VIQPFSVVELDLLKHNPDRPHSEDWHVEPRLRVVQELLTPEERAAFLQAIEDPAVHDIFGAPIHQDRGWFINRGEGERSLGTIRAALNKVVYRRRDDLGKWDYRLAFRDAANQEYRLGVTDLAFCLHLDALRDGGMAPPGVAATVGNALRSVDALYLRVGLARGWSEHPDRCFLQITGVFSFPDYVVGKCFADYLAAPDGRDRPLPMGEVPF